MSICNICPRNCPVERDDTAGFCGVTNTLKIARAALHFYEEPCISGTKGSGAVFFSGCNMRCVFCQNINISRGKAGKEITIQRLANIFFELEKMGANNINLVTPTHYVPQIIKAIRLAKNSGFSLPFVYNSSGYESVETLKKLDGFIDVYLPDFKYFDDELAIKYSSAPNYFDTVCAAVDEMVRQTGAPRYDEKGIIKGGVVVRHLVLPTHTHDSKNVLSYLHSTFGDEIVISVMSQYTPLRDIEKYPHLNRKITDEEYDEVVEYAQRIGITSAYTQSGDAASDSFIPEFDCTGV